MKFSVVIPVYNTEKFLPGCLDSVINQTYPDLEIIIVNDSSPGNVDEICRTYAAKDSRIKYICQDNQGVSVARNNGIAAAAGDYIYFLDSDDSMTSDFFEELHKALSAGSADIVIIDNGVVPLEYVATLPTWRFVISRKLLAQYPEIRFLKDLHPCEDNLLFYQLSCLTDKIIRCPEMENKFLYNTGNIGSVTKNMSSERHLKCCRTSLAAVAAFHDKYKCDNEKAVTHLTAFMKSIYAIFLDIQDETSKNEVLKQTQHFIRKYPLKKLSVRELVWFQRKFDIYIKSKSCAEYRFKSFIQKYIFSINAEIKHNCIRYIVRVCGVKVTFSPKG